MSKYPSHQLLKSTFENALLHLYFKVSSSRGFVNEKQRNKIIIDFFKTRIKQDRYQPIKKKLKTVCLMKDKFGSIEKHLERILTQKSTIDRKSDIDNLYLLLELFEKVGLDTKLVEETPIQEVDVVYLDRRHIDNCFDNDNRLIAPISLFIHTNELNKFTQCLTEQFYFKFEQHHMNQELGNYHYQLHPI
ncbi:DUF2913 domain-containing protein [Vibrio crassostreae]|uniref:DUF2913 family protein n=1 Tax=Vibrio crassostreae TaxID=246167 RepID=A0ABP1WM48_9VIBR|nr:DUF2913 family protein [Vibrio crassostreae]TCL22120.1 hypothetical protein EDB52_11120 [Vibrio crassostreae]TCN97944.1 hypothetical protein EDB30_115123 [Vibrio crassostreae]TCT44824.1 hypothetical protein EDB39_1235 [Vibrio crassostreae]TCT52431.1 hypothetical protein EDB40_11620 [Vibrio crassostreae]TCW04132.1 hypothetical protein EDB49_11229 [Vibrio crassostreae]